MVEFRSVSHLPGYVQVAAQIRGAILDRSMSRGEALPPERLLAKQFGVSRTTIREALRHLEAQGLLAARGRTSPMHAATPEAAVVRFRESLVHVVELSGVSLSNLVELRRAVEAAALTRAAREPVVEHLSVARGHLETMARHGVSVADFYSADVAFHVALVAASGNEALNAVMLAVTDAIRLHVGELLTPRRFAELNLQLIDEHRSILRAIERGNGKSASPLVRQHLSFYGT
jgi:DNA-binding FadR family transcriptional regulator